MPAKPIPKSIKQQLKSIRNKRARIVIEHILKHGFVTTENLEKQYGYSHPPRAVRDVREAGIPLETFRVKSLDGRSIAAYRFSDLAKIRKGQLQGRRTFPKQFKNELYEASGGKCAICNGTFENRYLQIDHRVPYGVAGDKAGGKLKIKEYMLVCGSCNRAKSWSCEQCPNMLNDKLPSVCLTCYWAQPGNYAHIALREIRRVDIIWNEEEVSSYERLKHLAKQNEDAVPEYVKRIIAKHLNEP